MINIGDLEKVLKQTFTGCAGFIYNSLPNIRPKDSNNNNASFIIADVENSIPDMNAYLFTISSILIYVPTLTNGEQNSVARDLIIAKIGDKFPISNKGYEFDLMPTIIPLGNDGKGYYVNKIQIQTIIKK